MKWTQHTHKRTVYTHLQLSPCKVVINHLPLSFLYTILPTTNRQSHTSSVESCVTIITNHKHLTLPLSREICVHNETLVQPFWTAGSLDSHPRAVSSSARQRERCEKGDKYYNLFVNKIDFLSKLCTPSPQTHLCVCCTLPILVHTVHRECQTVTVWIGLALKR